MSDGMNDACALGDLANKMHAAAVAIRAAEAGHRGLSIDPFEVANEALEAWSLRIEEKK